MDKLYIGHEWTGCLKNTRTSESILMHPDDSSYIGYSVICEPCKYYKRLPIMTIFVSRPRTANNYWSTQEARLFLETTNRTLR